MSPGRARWTGLLLLVASATFPAPASAGGRTGGSSGLQGGLHLSQSFVLSGTLHQKTTWSDGYITGGEGDRNLEYRSFAPGGGIFGEYLWRGFAQVLRGFQHRHLLRLRRARAANARAGRPASASIVRAPARRT